jgi:glycosyltransferase involved in cell wall biosynthesis
MKELILRSKNGIKIKVNFIGLNIMPEQEQRVNNLIKGFEDYFFLYDRMPKIEMQQFYENADFLLATSFDEIKGWYPVKIFEYATSGKPILLCPSDNDVLANFVKETNTGVSFNKTSELIDFLSKVILKKTKNEMFELKLNLNSLETYSRENQTKELALILDKF